VKIIRNIIAGLALGLLAACDATMVQPTAPAAQATQTVATTPTPPTGPDCSVQTGSFVLVATGFTNDTSGMATYKLFPCAKYALIFLPLLGGPSNATTFTASPLPDFLIPATLEWQEAGLHGFDQNVEHADISTVITNGSNVIKFFLKGDEFGWTPSSSKGAGVQIITVFLD
jgi:hypothetical protein